MKMATERKMMAAGYTSSSSVYRVDEAKARLGLSDAWLKKARVKGLTFSRVSNTGIEVIDGEELRKFIAAHPNLLAED